jgi:hypothetical protein
MWEAEMRADVQTEKASVESSFHDLRGKRLLDEIKRLTARAQRYGLSATADALKMASESVISEQRQKSQG